MRVPVIRPTVYSNKTDRSGTEPNDLGVITPNRLLLGRNNFRALAGTVRLSNVPSLYLQRHADITQMCLKILWQHVHRFIPRPKWLVGNQTVSVGDVVLFVHTENPTAKDCDHNYKFGRVTEVTGSGAMARVEVEYYNADSKRNKPEKTTRSMRQLVIIHRLDEVQQNTYEYFAAMTAQQNTQGRVDPTAYYSI